MGGEVFPGKKTPGYIQYGPVRGDGVGESVMAAAAAAHRGDGMNPKTVFENVESTSSVTRVAWWSANSNSTSWEGLHEILLSRAGSLALVSWVSSCGRSPPTLLLHAATKDSHTCLPGCLGPLLPELNSQFCSVNCEYTFLQLPLPSALLV